MKKKQLLYSGKAKSLFACEEKPEQLIVEFRDDLTAFNSEKKSSFGGKGKINNLINAHLCQLMAKNKIKTHLIKRIDDTHSLVHKLEMVKIESVCRNIATGSFCKRYGTPQKTKFKKPVLEFFLKDDDLGDPLINESAILALKLANKKFIKQSKKQTLKINKILKSFFKKHNLILVDFKLEFGWLNGTLILGDELTPDGCRLWDSKTHESYDKDVFRYNLGDINQKYQDLLELVIKN